ncbi:MAG: family 2 glycosyl transferase [Microgenomates group bacterium GW2011_GWA1_48_10]|nr:MAG: family 2 glycosyl transferase [Microgenomates group bacterium GW2011_GWA1_48_10]
MDIIARKQKMARNLNKDVCAVIVTLNSGQEVPSLISVAPQVPSVVLIDNGSQENLYQATAKLVKQFPNAILLRNAENMGIAAALNRGVRYAQDHDYTWVLTLDDDSEIAPDMVANMLSSYNALPELLQKKVGILAPNYTNTKGKVYSLTTPTIIPTAITSGQLVHTRVYEKIGYYKEGFIVGCVDHEFCFRALSHNIHTLLVPTAFLHQRLGRPSLHSFLGKQFVVPHYSPTRYYYTYRNSIYLYKKYFTKVPGWICANIWSNFLSFIKIILFEDKKYEKTAVIARGCVDGLRGVYGKISIL